MNAVAQDVRYIVTGSGVRSGQPIVAGTRIAVHGVLGLILNGARADGAVESSPPLMKAQMYECLACHEDHKTEIDHAVIRQMAEEEARDSCGTRMFLQKSAAF